jgi:hemerythrin-like domain-containing protein
VEVITMNAIALLEKDHKKMKSLLEDLEETTRRASKKREELFATIRVELQAHETIEEEIFYPALKQHPKAKDIVLEGYVEHHVADLIVNELASTPTTDEDWGARAKVLKEVIEHHIEEEEGEMFKMARKLLDREELADLGEKMEQRKDVILGQLAAV